MPITENDINFFDDEYEGKLDLEQAIDISMQELKVKDKNDFADPEKLILFVKSVQSKAKVSLRELASILEINRERLRKLMSSITSP